MPSEGRGREFESRRVRQIRQGLSYQSNPMLPHFIGANLSAACPVATIRPSAPDARKTNGAMNLARSVGPRDCPWRRSRTRTSTARAGGTLGGNERRR